jgi:phosphate starvation-inducible protein PhoH
MVLVNKYFCRQSLVYILKLKGGHLMGAKRARKSKNFHNNVVQINNFLPEKQKTVKIIPRNKNQEEYMLTLADNTKDVVFGIGWNR